MSTNEELHNTLQATEDRATRAERARILALIDEWHAYLKSLGRPNRVRATYMDALENIKEKIVKVEGK
jgi:hypothetical protein